MKEVVSIPLNFTQTFLPDRTLIARLLAFASSNGSGTKEQISEATGIPTGASSGKVEPMIYYSMAMGIVNANRVDGVWCLSLTSIGKIVYEEDPYLSETITLWLLHIMMCRPLKSDEQACGIADAWFALFADRGYRLGKQFTIDAYTDFLIERHGSASTVKRLPALIVRMYEEESALGLASVLTPSDNDNYQFLPAPNERSYYPLYSAYLLLLWDQLFPTQQQVQLSELFEKGRLFTLLNWSKEDACKWQDWMSDHKVLQFDRQTGETLALRLQSTEQAIEEIYSLLI